MENYYDILEVSQKASKEIITKAYRTLVKKYHPDANSKNDKPIDDEKIKKINEAYDVLCDEEKRKNYDKELERLKEQENNNMQQRYEKILEQNQLLQQELANLKARYQGNYNNPSLNNTYNETSNKDTNDSIGREVNQNYNDNLQQEIDRRVSQSINKAYKDAYIQRMRDYGYRIHYKKTLKERAKDLFSIFLAIIIVSIILFILWQIPSVRNHVESNKIFQAFMNSFFRK